jgi:hypothetical protein
MPSKTFAHGGHAAARGITLRQLESRIRIARVTAPRKKFTAAASSFETPRPAV